MGDEVSKRTVKAFEAGLKTIARRLDDSLETEKEKNDFLTGVPAIVQAIRDGKIECRVYRKDKFHAKAQRHACKKWRLWDLPHWWIVQFYTPRSN